MANTTTTCRSRVLLLGWSDMHGNLYIANLGDSCAVLGTLVKPRGEVLAIQLSAEHNTCIESQICLSKAENNSKNVLIEEVMDKLAKEAILTKCGTNAYIINKLKFQKSDYEFEAVKEENYGQIFRNGSKVQPNMDEDHMCMR
ncbi:hypothetical protein ACET3Z_030703 [Daucus carota]